MLEVSSKIRLLDGDNVYQVTSTGKALSTTILTDAFHKMKVQPNCLNENFLNHWIDYDEISSNEVSLSTQLDNNESTISDYKSSVAGPQLSQFKDSMLPVLKAFLEFSYYMELGKQWNTPIDPLNLIYVDNGIDYPGNVKSFYHNDSTIPDAGTDFLNNVIKMMIYLFVPEETSSVNEYFDKTPQDYYDSLDSPDLIAKYDPQEVEDLSDFIYNIQTNDLGEPIQTVKDIFHSLGDDLTPQKIEDSAGVVDSTKPNRLTDYLSPAEKAAQEEALRKEKAAKDAAEAAANDPKRKKQEELKRKEEERKQKEAELKKQQENAKKQRELDKQKKQQEFEDQLAEKEAKKKKIAEEKRQEQKQKEADAAERRKKAAEEKEAKRKAKMQAKVDRAATNRKVYETWPWYRRPWAITAYVIIGIGGLTLGGFTWHSHNVKVAEEQAEQARNNKNPQKSPYFNSGTAASGAQNYKAAATSFDKFFEAGGTLSELNNNQISSVFAAYLNTNQYQKILDNIGSPQTATALINYLTGKKDLKAANNLQSKQPIINLAKAVVNDDYQGITQQANNCDTSQNGILQLDICKAYAKTKKIADGKTWADNQKNSANLKKAIITYALNNGMKRDVINKEMS